MQVQLASASTSILNQSRWDAAMRNALWNIRSSASTADVGPRAASPGGTSLRISAGPGVTSLLAGKALVVLKDNLENVLASAGISAQGGSSRVSAWAHACERSAREPICQQGVNGL